MRHVGTFGPRLACPGMDKEKREEPKDKPGEKEQRDAANQPESPGEPATGE